MKSEDGNDQRLIDFHNQVKQKDEIRHYTTCTVLVELGKFRAAIGNFEFHRYQQWVHKNDPEFYRYYLSDSQKGKPFFAMVEAPLREKFDLELCLRNNAWMGITHVNTMYKNLRRVSADDMKFWEKRTKTKMTVSTMTDWFRKTIEDATQHELIDEIDDIAEENTEPTTDITEETKPCASELQPKRGARKRKETSGTQGTRVVPKRRNSKRGKEVHVPRMPGGTCQPSFDTGKDNIRFIQGLLLPFLTISETQRADFKCAISAVFESHLSSSKYTQYATTLQQILPPVMTSSLCVQASPVHGLGLFARVDIQAGEDVCEYVGRLLTVEEVQVISESSMWSFITTETRDGLWWWRLHTSNVDDDNQRGKPAK